MKATVVRATLDDIRAFVAVVEEGSFSAAARVLGVPKSSVSRRVAHLEQSLATKLLQRTTRKLRLTDAGQSYFERCRRAFEQLHDAEQTLEHLQAEPRGVLKVTAPASFGYVALSGLIEAYNRRYPDVMVVVDLSNRMVDLVAEGYDVAIRAGPLVDSTMVARRVLADGFVLVASPDYLERRGRPATLAELAQHDCLLFRGEDVRTTWTLHGPAGVESVVAGARLVSNDLKFLAAAAERGAGITLLPLLTGRDGIASGKLERVLPQYSSEPGSISVVYPSATHLSPKTRAFVEMAVEYLQHAA